MEAMEGKEEGMPHKPPKPCPLVPQLPSELLNVLSYSNDYHTTQQAPAKVPHPEDRHLIITVQSRPAQPLLRPPEQAYRVAAAGGGGAQVLR